MRILNLRTRTVEQTGTVHLGVRRCPGKIPLCTCVNARRGQTVLWRYSPIFMISSKKAFVRPARVTDLDEKWVFRNKKNPITRQVNDPRRARTRKAHFSHSSIPILRAWTWTTFTSLFHRSRIRWITRNISQATNPIVKQSRGNLFSAKERRFFARTNYVYPRIKAAKLQLHFRAAKRPSLITEKRPLEIASVTCPTAPYVSRRGSNNVRQLFLIPTVSRSVSVWVMNHS